MTPGSAAPSTDRLLVWHVAGRPDGAPALATTVRALADRAVEAAVVEATDPVPSDRPALVHLHGLPAGDLDPTWSRVLATVPYLVSISPADLGHRHRRPLDQRARRLLRGAQVVLVPDAELLWGLTAVRHLPPARVVPAFDGEPRREPAVVDLRDDGSLLGDWGFGIWDEPADPASTLASIYRDLA